MRQLIISIFVIAMALTAFANQNPTAVAPSLSLDWPFGQLPKFQTKQELESGSVPALDRITPPPAGPVILDPEFGEREGIIVRYPFGFGDIFPQMVDNLQEYGIVYILVNNAFVESECYNYLASFGVPWENIECIHTPTNANWTRDYGPWFVWEENGDLSIVDMIYYPDRPDDDFVPEFLETHWGLGYYGPDIDHEGGNLMTDGHGTLMMSTHVFEANPGMTSRQVVELHQDYFGCDTTYIFERIQHDLTGHIDLWSKIMNDTTILVAQMLPDDDNYQLVENHAAMMDNIPTYNGGTYHIVRCPMPPLAYQWIYEYYKSYINSVLFNGLALIPIYGLQTDDAAIAAYQEALGPNWDVVGIDCNTIAWAGGAIHCTSIGVPEHEELYAHEVDFSFEPVSAPIVIPASGGNFNYEVGVENLETENYLFDFWVDVVLPNGSVFGPVFMRPSVNMGSLASINRELAQFVPPGAPAGTYTYRGHVGSYLPLIITGEDSFTFEKSGAADGSNRLSNWQVDGWTDGEIRNIVEAPRTYTMMENFPNPFNPETTIAFELPETMNITLSIYNVNGQLVETLADGTYNAGTHSLTWNAENLPSGVYFSVLNAGGNVQTRKMILMK